MLDNKTNTLLLMVMGIVILLMIAITVLFLRMTQLQRTLIAVLGLPQAQASSAYEEARGLEVGTTAPAFTLSNLEGQETSLTDFQEQQVLLAFTSSQCPPCQQMYPHLQAFSERKANVQIVMITLGSVEENQQLVVEHGFDFPVLLWEEEMANTYRISSTPFFYVVDPQGVITGKGVANTLQQLELLFDSAAEGSE